MSFIGIYYSKYFQTRFLIMIFKNSLAKKYVLIIFKINPWNQILEISEMK